MSINQRHSHSWRWGDGEKISYNDLKDKPEDSTLKYYQENDTQFTWAYSWWTFNYTVWFRPKKITFQAVRSSNNFWWSHWCAIVDTDWNISNGCQYKKWWFTNAWQISANKCIFVQQSVEVTASVTAVSSTWFTLTVDNNNYNFDLLITVEWV
jgi:hypothetical protein